MAHGLYLYKGATDPIEVFEVGAEDLSPLQPPPDSDKVHRSLPATSAARRTGSWRGIVLLLLIACALCAAIISGWYKFAARSDVAFAMDQAEIEQRVANLKGEPAVLLRANPPLSKEVELVEIGDNKGFEVMRDERLYDVRGWKEVPPEKVSDLYSPVSSLRWLSLKKIASGAHWESQVRSAGLNIFTSCLGPYPYEVQTQRGETLTGQERMKVCKMSVDLSAVPVGAEFTLNTNTTMWNSLQTEEDQWFGLIGYPKSAFASMLILFPEHKPLRDYRLTVSKTTKSNLMEYDGPRVVFVGKNHDWIFWKIPSPSAGMVYRLYWTW